MNYSSLSKLKSYINSSIVLIFFTILALVCANTPIIQLLNKERAQKKLVGHAPFYSFICFSLHTHTLSTHTLSFRLFRHSPLLSPLLSPFSLTLLSPRVVTYLSWPTSL